MRVALIGSLSILIAGCTADIPDKHLSKAQELCSKNDGVKYVSGLGLIHATVDISVDCNNGAYFYIGKLK